MANRLSIDPAKLHQTLKNTVFAKANDEEFMALVMVSNRYDLDPLLKQIFAFPAKSGGIVPVVSIDGWLHIINSHPQMDGMTFQHIRNDGGDLEAITCRIFRKDRAHPVEITEYLSECQRNTEPWKMAYRMLRHKALIQCARYAFGISGITDEDEAPNTPGMRNVTPRETIAPVSNVPKPVDEQPLSAEVQTAKEEGDLI